DCLRLLAQAVAPLSSAEVRKELEGTGAGTHGLVTVERALRRLRELRLVGLSARSPRGFYLPDTMPLFASCDPARKPPPSLLTAADACLAELAACGERPRHESAVAAGGGRTALLLALPRPPRDPRRGG